ncbi:MAG: pilus assembly protein [Acidobacteria bacterium]|nr:pilus assembly protein [Acidobacteriota bacterium]
MGCEDQSMSVGGGAAWRRRRERGAALVEFAIAATVFLTTTFAVLELGRLLWVHNALTDATRRAARYAVNQPQTAVADIKNVAVYGNKDGTGTPLVTDLTTDQVVVTYNNFGVGAGTVTVSIQNYDFRFVLPLVGTTMRLPAYSTTLTGENSGWVPNPI